MAVIDPSTRAADDVRPVFDASTLPGGPWRTYRSRQTTDAVFVTGPFLIRQPSDGLLVEESDAWVHADPTTGEPVVVDPATFSASYELAQ